MFLFPTLDLVFTYIFSLLALYQLYRTYRSFLHTVSGLGRSGEAFAGVLTYMAFLVSCSGNCSLSTTLSRYLREQSSSHLYRTICDPSACWPSTGRISGYASSLSL